MTIINGTSGDDRIEPSQRGGYDIFAGAGADYISVYVDEFKVAIDAGDGDDTIVVGADLISNLTVKGGAGNDTFNLYSGGLLEGGPGADTYKVLGSGSPFQILDFSAEDRLDLSPFLAGYGPGFDPFANGMMRLAQLGADSVLQSRVSGTWKSLGVLANIDSASLTPAQLGFKPVVQPVTFASLRVLTPTIMEGGRATVEVTLSTPLAKSSTIFGQGIERYAGGAFDGGFGGQAAAGQSVFQFSFVLTENGRVDAGKFSLSLVTFLDAYFPDPRANSYNLRLDIVDNDTNGFSVLIPSGYASYTAITRLPDVRPQDKEAVAQIFPERIDLSTREMVQIVEKLVLGTTSVALTAYQFFTGKIPTEQGVDYLVAPAGPNPSNLNSAYYQSFNLENRYINFAVNLGKVGEGRAQFEAKYGAMSLLDSTREAYKTIFGTTPTDEKVHALIDTRVDYFASYGGDGADGIGTKAAMVGWLLAEAEKAGAGAYARAVENFYTDLTDGSAHFNVDLVGVYGPGTFLDQMG
ncbi:MAG TPA: hypothetical protein VN158_01765 [Caulobacter sp.]|nr:hypothetical protein [Caulobacter sp.]